MNYKGANNKKSWIPGHDGLREFRAEGRQIALSTFAALGLLSLDLLKPWPLAWILDSLYLHSTEFTPQACALALVFMLLIHLSRALLGAWRESVLIGVGLRGLRKIRERFFSKLLVWDFHEAQHRDTEKTLYSAAWDTYSFQTQFQQWAGALIEACFSLIGMSLVMLIVQPRLAWIALIAAPVTIIWLRYAAGAMTNAGNTARESDTEVTQNFGRAIHHLNLIQLFQHEPNQQSRFLLKARQSQRDRYLQHRQEIIYSAGVSALFGVLTVAIVGYGVWLIRQDLLSPGELVVFLAYLGQWYGPLNQISQFGSVNADAQAGIHRVYEAMQPKTLLGSGSKEIESNLNPAPNPSFKSPWILEWKNLGFQYDQESEFLFKDFTGSVQTGQIVVLKGASGSGKTTFARLLTHWIGHQEGKILLQNLEIQQWPKQELRQQFSWANQHPAIWPGTLRENLEMALVLDEQQSSSKDLDSKFLSVLEDIGATELLENLKQGLDTVIGEPGGISLSLGERQRIHLARALLKPAPILILDEPTSSLDECSAILIRAAIEKRKAQQAILVISHEPLWWEKADKIHELSDYVCRKK